MISSWRVGLPFLMAPCLLCGRMTTRLLTSSVGVHAQCEERQETKSPQKAAA